MLIQSGSLLQLISDTSDEGAIWFATLSSFVHEVSEVARDLFLLPSGMFLRL